MTAVRLLNRALAFGAGAAAACLALNMSHVIRAQTSGPTINLCFGAKGDLRIVEPREPCRPDERRVQVKQPDPKPNEEPERNSRAEALKRRLSTLEERERRGRLVPTRVVAPFEVIDSNQQRMFFVEEQSVTVYNKARQPVVWILADETGGALQVQAANGAKTATLSALDKRAHLLIQEGAQDRIDLGRRVDGRYGLKVFSKTGKLTAYLGQSDMGNGLAFVADTGGNRGVEVFADDNTNTGSVAVKNAKGLEVASLFSDPEGAGRLRLTNSSGDLRVNAGVTSEGRGVVQTGPGFNNSGVGILALVPSYILGKPK